MRILFLGDIVGEVGCRAIYHHLPQILEERRIDFTIVNAENAAKGFGLSKVIARDLFDSGVDAITLGDHAFDNPEIYSFLEEESRIVRPHNIAINALGHGAAVLSSKRGHRVLVVQILGRVFMQPHFGSPWTSIDNCISKNSPIESGLDALVLDIHAEATSEKQAVGWYLDGYASMVVGTHTHVPTSDTRILPRGTAYQTDAGMCGCYRSIIGMQKENALNRIVGMLPKKRFVPAEHAATLCGIIIETSSTGLAKTAQSFRIGEPI